MSLTQSIINSFLAPYLKDFEDAMREGQAVRGAWIIQAAINEYPLAAGFIQSLFTGTPGEVLEKAEAWMPGVSKMPGAEAFAGQVQKQLQHEWSKPR